MLIKDLPPRQRELVRYVAAGHTNPEIATLMGITEQTVKNMLVTLSERLGVTNRFRIILYFYRIIPRGRDETASSHPDPAKPSGVSQPTAP